MHAMCMFTQCLLRVLVSFNEVLISCAVYCSREQDKVQIKTNRSITDCEKAV